MTAPITTRAEAAVLFGAALLMTDCYAETVSDCYYYYGYQTGYPYCEYDYLEPYTPANGYAPLSYHEVEPTVTPNPSPDVAAKLSDSSVEISAFLYLERTADTGKTNAGDVLNKRYPCGRGEQALTLCAVENLTARDTDYILIAVHAAKPVAHDDAKDAFVIGFSFDSDGDASNNYEPPAELAFDYFGATDRWYASTYRPGGEWKLQAYGLLDGVPTPINSEARVILQEQTAALIVPASEFEVETPGARFSFLRQSPSGDWSGLVFPPLGDPLAGL